MRRGPPFAAPASPTVLWACATTEVTLTELMTLDHILHQGIALGNCLKDPGSFSKHRAGTYGAANYCGDVARKRARLFSFNQSGKPLVTLDVCLVCSMPHFEAITAAHNHRINGTEPWFDTLIAAVRVVHQLTGAPLPGLKHLPDPDQPEKSAVYAKAERSLHDIITDLRRRYPELDDHRREKYFRVPSPNAQRPPVVLPPTSGTKGMTIMFGRVAFGCVVLAAGVVPVAAAEDCKGGLVCPVCGSREAVEVRLAQAGLDLFRCKLRNISGIRFIRFYADPRNLRRAAAVEYDLNGRSCIIANTFDLGSVDEPKAAPDWSTPME